MARPQHDSVVAQLKRPGAGFDLLVDGLEEHAPAREAVQAMAAAMAAAMVARRHLVVTAS